IAEVICSIDPTKLSSVPIGQQHTRHEDARRHLGDDPIFDLFAAVLNRVQIFITSPKYKIVFVIWVDVQSMRFQNPLHATAEDGATPPPLKREVPPVLELSPGFDPCSWRQFDCSCHFWPALPASVRRLSGDARSI